MEFMDFSKHIEWVNHKINESNTKIKSLSCIQFESSTLSEMQRGFLNEFINDVFILEELRDFMIEYERDELI